MKESSSPHEQGEEINSLQSVVNILSKRKCSNNVGIPVVEVPSSYNIEKNLVLSPLIFTRRKWEEKKFQKVKESYGQVKKITKEEVLFD